MCVIAAISGDLRRSTPDLEPHLKNSSVSREQFKSSLKTWLFVQAYS